MYHKSKCKKLRLTVSGGKHRRLSSQAWSRQIFLDRVQKAIAIKKTKKTDTFLSSLLLEGPWVSLHSWHAPSPHIICAEPSPFTPISTMFLRLWGIIHANFAMIYSAFPFKATHSFLLKSFPIFFSFVLNNLCCEIPSLIGLSFFYYILKQIPNILFF